MHWWPFKKEYKSSLILETILLEYLLTLKAFHTVNHNILLETMVAWSFFTTWNFFIMVLEVLLKIRFVLT